MLYSYKVAAENRTKSGFTSISREICNYSFILSYWDKNLDGYSKDKVGRSISTIMTIIVSDSSLGAKFFLILDAGSFTVKVN